MYIAKPIFFSFSPDGVHTGMIRFARFLGRFSAVRALLRFLFGQKNEVLRQEYFGYSFQSPIGLSAGFDKYGEITPVISAVGFGFETVGSVTAVPSEGNPRPWFYRLPKTQSLVVNAGLPNPGAKKVLAQIEAGRTHIGADFPVVLSVAKTNSSTVVREEDGVADYIATLKLARKHRGVQLFELNISCPNAYGGEAFTTPASLEHLLAEVDKIKLKKPVLVKMPSSLPWRAFKQLLEVIARHNVAGVTIANLAKDRSKVELLDELPDTVRGNLSGKPTWHLSNELIKKTYQHYGDTLVIVGAGGVFSAQDAYTKIKLGASLVDLITGMIFVGPQLVAQINDELPKLLEKDGYTHISQAVGVDAKAS